MTLEQQPPFLIYVPIDHSNALPGLAAREIEALLDRLGNPANPALNQALDASRVIHFLSFSVIWDEGSEDPPILVADVAGDGPPETVIAALVDHAWGHLLPVFQVAAGVETKEALRALLERRWVKPVGASFPLQPRRATGLPFQGTPGLTVARIKEDACIAGKARAAVFDHAPHGPSASLSYLGAARARAGVAHPSGDPFEYSDAPPSLAKASVLAKAWAVFGVVLIDWSFLVVFLFSFLFLSVHDLALSLNGRSHPTFDKILMFFIASCVISLIVHITLQSYRVDIAAKIRRYSILIPIGLLGIFVGVVIVFYFLSPDVGGWVDSVMTAISNFNSEGLLVLWMAIVLSVLAAAVFVAILAAILVGILRAAEKRDRPCDADPDPELLAKIIGREDLPPHKQNHLIAVSTLSPGFFRRFVFLPAALYAASLAVRAGMFRIGYLAGIRTIHFLQWTHIPGTGKLVFTADYDGSFQSYLEDAITLLPTGATAIWSNAIGFPKTSYLFFEGAKDGDRFKRWVRRQMIPTRFWYSAYPHLTTTDIRLNAAIRQGLEAKAMTPSQADVWLKLFGSAPRPVGEIETDQIQGLALGGYRNLLEGAVLAVSFPESPSACQTWLADVSARLHFGDAEPADGAMAVALSARGLTRLGLEATHPLAARFSPAFAMGMTAEARRNILGDVDGNAPETWGWGKPDDPADAVLLIYAVDQATLRTRLTVETTACASAGMGQPREIVFRRWPPSRDSARIKEPFGFVDGISQPSIKGPIASRGAPKTDLLEPGEFILGYPDGRNRFPSTPQVLATNDPDRLLPDLPPNFPRPPSDPAVRDLGRNGSYLVIRQLKQDVEAFEDYLVDAAGQVGETPEWVAAKMVGRWRNGAPLVLFPYGPPATYDPLAKDETFLFGRDDPQGLACPFGAHIRRANPRDQLDADDETEMSITNRHRIIRRGRAYVDGTNSAAKAQGLMFMCLNADIERQFEFLQQTWIGSTSFGPLRDEADPLTAPNRTDGTYTIPAFGGPKRLTGMPSFVSVIGGGYFFLPGRQTLNFLSRQPVATWVEKSASTRTPAGVSSTQCSAAHA